MDTTIYSEKVAKINSLNNFYVTSGNIVNALEDDSVEKTVIRFSFF